MVKQIFSWIHNCEIKKLAAKKMNIFEGQNSKLLALIAYLIIIVVATNSDITIAIQAPTAPYLGINMKQAKIFIKAPQIVLYAIHFVYFV